MRKCRIRKDLLEQNLKIPVGDKYIAEDREYSYRWLKDQFQIYLNGKFQDASSIDFEFN